MENSIEFFLNTHLEWSLSRQDLVITLVVKGAKCKGTALVSLRQLGRVRIN